MLYLWEKNSFVGGVLHNCDMEAFLYYLVITVIIVLVGIVVLAILFSFYVGLTYKPEDDKYLDSARWIDGK